MILRCSSSHDLCTDDVSIYPIDPIRLMHESAIGGRDQWLPRCRSNIGIRNEIVGSFLLVLNSMALYTIWIMLCNLISE